MPVARPWHAQVKTAGTGRWRELCHVAADATFGRTGPLGSDLWLRNGDQSGELFSTVEAGGGVAVDAADPVSIALRR